MDDDPVAYLLGERCSVSGQVFLVGGGRVRRASPRSLDPGWRLDKGGRWEPEQLAEAVRAAGPPTNTGRDTGGIIKE